MSNEVARARNLAAKMIKLGFEIEKAETALDAMKRQYFKIEEEDLPALIDEMQMPFFKMKDGFSIEMTEDFHCSITAANQKEAHAWLTARKLDGIIETIVAARYERDERKKALKDRATVSKTLKRPAYVDESIHWQRLKATLKILREEAADKPDNNPPEALFSIHPFRVAKVIPAKGKRFPKIKRKGSERTRSSLTSEGE